MNRQLSEMELDELATGVPPTSEQQEILDASPALRQELEERKGGFESLDEGPSPFVKQRVLAAFEMEAAPKKGGFFHWAMIPAMAACAAIALVTVVPPEEDDITRAKGTAALYVHRAIEGKTQRMASGAQFHEGDRVRLEVDLPQEGYVAVVGREPNGKLYRAWPQTDAPTRRLRAKPAQLLEGAMELDASVGDEHLFLVVCSSGTDPACGLEKDDVRCRQGCDVRASFLMRKR